MPEINERYIDVGNIVVPKNSPGIGYVIDGIEYRKTPQGKEVVVVHAAGRVLRPCDILTYVSNRTPHSFVR